MGKKEDFSVRTEILLYPGTVETESRAGKGTPHDRRSMASLLQMAPEATEATEATEAVEDKRQDRLRALQTALANLQPEDLDDNADPNVGTVLQLARATSPREWCSR